MSVRPVASLQARKLGREFFGVLKRDMDETSTDVVAQWTRDGFLLVLVRGAKANTLDALVRDHEIAQPIGRSDISQPRSGE